MTSRRSEALSKEEIQTSIAALSKTVQAVYAWRHAEPKEVAGAPQPSQVRTFFVWTWLGALTREGFGEPLCPFLSIHSNQARYRDVLRIVEDAVNRLPRSVRKDLPIAFHSGDWMTDAWSEYLRHVSPISLVREGYRTMVAEAFSSVLDVRPTELLTTLGMPQRTVSRRLKEHKKLTTEESDRLYRALEIMRSAVETFGDPDLAAKWLKEPNPAIGGVTPLSLLDTQPGRDQVATLLGRIEHGIYT